MLRLYQNVLIGIDYIFINGFVFFITVSCNIKFTIIEFVISKGLKTVLKYFGSIIKLYTRRGFKIKTILDNNTFTPLKPKLAEKHQIEFNSPSVYEYQNKIERMICVVKNRFRATYSRFP